MSGKGILGCNFRVFPIVSCLKELYFGDHPKETAAEKFFLRKYPKID